MNQKREAYAPWISDPDPPEKPMSDQEAKAFAKRVAELLKRKKAQEADLPSGHRVGSPHTR
jgi:hypothetical protein